MKNNRWFAGLVMVMGAVAFSVQAADGEKEKKLTAEQQQQRSGLIQKYDANQDGFLDNAETKAMNKADKKALAKLGGVGTANKGKTTGKVKGEEKSKKKGKAGKVESEGKGKRPAETEKAEKEGKRKKSAEVTKDKESKTERTGKQEEDEKSESGPEKVRKAKGKK